MRSIIRGIMTIFPMLVFVGIGVLLYLINGPWAEPVFTEKQEKLLIEQEEETAWVYGDGSTIASSIRGEKKRVSKLKRGIEQAEADKERYEKGEKELLQIINRKWRLTPASPRRYRKYEVRFFK
jgi:uncharacterized protein YhbP (UPF0306 family)